MTPGIWTYSINIILNAMFQKLPGHPEPLQLESAVAVTCLNFPNGGEKPAATSNVTLFDVAPSEISQ